MRKRSQTQCCRPVSVRLSMSVTLVHYIHMAEVIVKLLCWPGNPIILVFWPPVPVPNFKGTPSAGAQNTRAVGKFCDFRLKSPSISEMMGLSDGRKSFHLCLAIWYNIGVWRTPSYPASQTRFRRKDTAYYIEQVQTILPVYCTGKMLFSVNFRPEPVQPHTARGFSVFVT